MNEMADDFACRSPHEPDVVGLLVMTFQRKTAKGIIDLVRTRRPSARVVGKRARCPARARPSSTKAASSTTIRRGEENPRIVFGS
jgi:hypothetical protein